MDKIKKWMLKTIKDGSWKKNNDLHIDEISKEFKNPLTWVEGGISCFEKAIKIRDKQSLPFVIELFIDLKSKKKKIGINFVTLKELNTQVSWTPPSLYLIKGDYRGWMSNIKKGTRLKFKDFKNKSIKCYYSEKLWEDPEYLRSVYFISKPKK